MGIISKQYIKNLVGRYDKQVGIPYYSYTDFKGLKQELFVFTNSKGIEIHYFYYYRDNFRKDKTILFCPGIGPGHTAYLAEINQLTKRGYRVLTLDYTGCDSSKGKYMGSLNMPTLDVNELLDHLKLDNEVVLVGHSLGGYTSLNSIKLRKEITKAVILSPFLSIETLLRSFIKSSFVVKRILKYEQKTVGDYYGIDNLSYLKETKDKLLFIQSDDDPTVPYDISLKVVEGIDNSCIKTIRMSNRKHNPNYTEKAANYLFKVLAKYNKAIADKKIKNDEDRINFFKGISIEDLTEQDEEVFNQISAFIDQ